MSIFDSATLGTADNQITFNGTTFPIYRAVSRAPRQRQIRELDIALPFESGISDFETLIGRMAYIIEGKMYPSGEADYSTGLAALRKLASLDVEQADAAADDGYVPYVYSENGTDNRQIFLKVLYVDIPESTRTGLIQPFRLVCKIKDPTIYGYPAKTASTQSVDPTLVGGTALYSFTYPIIFGASNYSVSSTASNHGTIPAYPTSIVVHGPINNPTITNSATGEYITVGVNLTSSSDVLTIIYDKDSLSVDFNGTSALASVTTGSTYFKLQPGANTINLSGSTISSGAYVVLNYMDSYALS
jgi:hypothetical protein